MENRAIETRVTGPKLIGLLLVTALLVTACGGSGAGGGGGVGSSGGGSDASLSSLSASTAFLFPAFSPSVLSYTGSVSDFTHQIFFRATTTDPNASFKISGMLRNICCDDLWGLAVGDNTFSIVVTAANRTASRTYTIVITRASMAMNTTIGWNGEDNLAPFGKGNNGAGALNVFGQTFVVAADAPTLQQLSFWLQHSPNDTSGEDVFFSVVVMAWNTDRATGPVLYESALQSITTAQSMMTEYRVDTGGLILVPGQQYVAFLSANNGFWNTTSTPIRVGFQNADVYSQGAAWIVDTDNNLNLVTSAPWMNPSGTADLVVMFSF